MTLSWWKKPPWQKKIQKSHFLASGANLVNFELGEVCFGYTYKHHCCIFLHHIAQGSIGPIILVPRQLCQNMGHSSGHHTFIKCLLCLLRTNICTLLKVGWKNHPNNAFTVIFLFVCLLSHLSHSLSHLFIQLSHVRSPNESGSPPRQSSSNMTKTYANRHGWWREDAKPFPPFQGK